MSERKTVHQDNMLGVKIKNQTSGTAHSSKVNDVERRAVKRSERIKWREDVRAGRYNDALRVTKDVK